MKAALLIVFALFSALPLSAEEIPLKKVWGARMPGTRPIRELEPRAAGDRGRHGPVMSEIVGALIRPVEGKEDAGYGFPVEGTGHEALQEAKLILANDAEPFGVLKAGEVSLVFYSHGSTMYVHLKQVKRKANVITLNYRFVHHETEEITAHFALVPLGKLPAGKYEVKHVQLLPDYSRIRPQPKEIKLVPPEWERRIVSLPYTFEVK